MGGGNRTVEIVTIGDELLLGQTVDTNSAFLGRVLGAAGFRVCGRRAVGDDWAAIKTAVDEALSRADIVLCTGGLGPTVDDLTRGAIAELFGVPTDIDESLLAALQERYRQRGLPMPRSNITQAEVPRGARVLPNRYGSAPGLALERDGHIVLLLPGVPNELEHLTRDQVLPFLLGRATSAGIEQAPPVYLRLLRTTGLGESALAERVEHVLPQLPPLTLAFLPSRAGTDLRLTSWGVLGEAEAERKLDAATDLLCAAVGEYVYAIGDTDLVEVIGEQLRQRNLHIALAESCSGGLLARRFTDFPGASDYFLGGVVAYDNAVKRDILGVHEDVLARYGAVSEEAAVDMAQGARKRLKADVAIGITGIAGPGGGTSEKPVGTVCIAVVVRDRCEVRRVLLIGDRDDVRERAAQTALFMLWRMLQHEEDQR